MATERERRRALVLGALVADAAALGFHWLYDPKRISDIAGDSPEFFEPDAEHFKDVAGYFVHGHQKSGDLSMYGDGLMVVLQTLAANGGTLDPRTYETAFREYFGFGGAYVGYIDHPTHDTLLNSYRAEEARMERVLAAAGDLDENTRRMLASKVMGNAKMFGPDRLAEEVEKAVRMTKDDDELVATALRMVHELGRETAFPGTDDTQLPALVKNPPIVALYAGDASLLARIEPAVRVTHDNPTALAYSRAMARLQEAVVMEKPVAEAARDAFKDAPDEIRGKVDEALGSVGTRMSAVAKKFGLACQLDMGVPIGIHMAASAGSFTEGVRANVAVGGESCGRAMVVGSLLGARFGIGGETGIPQAWIDRLSQKERIVSLLADLGLD